ncbi:MAG: hypothetical protein GX076_08780 [Clostridiales bacterium]|nr:hypothetical protein [Clostridiales bacterium]
MNNQQLMDSAVKDAMEFRMVYPEIYYKIQPFVLMMCDEMDAYGTGMPTQEMIDHMTDHIYDNLCRMYPELRESAEETAKEVNVQFRPYGYGRRRRRGFLGDLINILLLTELFGRRRRRFYY